MRFRQVKSDDYPNVVELTSNIWEGKDYIPFVFEKWLKERNSFFYCIENEQNQLIALGRLLLFDKNTGWLEGLRVATSFQKRGFGKEMAKRMICLSKSLGVKTLYFSTYFGNAESIYINEKMGFSRVAVYTNLQLDTLHFKANNTVTKTFFDLHGFIPNDWVFFPSEIAESFLPELEFVEILGCQILFSRNIKFPDTLEMSWFDPLKVSEKVVERAISFAGSKGYRKMHLMVKASLPLNPFLKNGFHYFEKSEDVYLYGGEVERLKLI